MAKFEIKESFSWIVPEWRAVDATKRTVKIKGIALPKDVVSRNKRKYVDEEIKRAARTLSGKPINVNHNDKKIVGNVIHAEYENGAIEYLGQIKKEPYVTMLKEKDPRLKGVSVQAGYLHNRCIYCGERFYSEEAFKQHMSEAHGIVDGIKEVHGIIFDALSLVVDPEAPGVEGATAELWETLRRERGDLRLLETVTQFKKEELNVKEKFRSKAAVTPQKRIAADVQKLKEQDEDIKPGSHYCEEHPDDPRCKEHKKAIHGEEQDEHGCAEDEEWDGEKCVKKQQTKEQEDAQQELPKPTVEAPTKCEGDLVYDEESGTCIPKEWPAEPTADTPAPLQVPEPVIEPPKTEAPAIPAPQLPVGPVIEQEGTETPPMQPFPTPPPEAPAAITQPCPEGSHRDPETNTCIPDTPTPTEVTDMVREFRLPTLLPLGEPFADYKDFDDCVAKNKGKVDDPEAYCADIKRKVEGETVRETLVKDFPLLSEVDKRHTIQNIRNAQSINQLNRTMAKIGKAVAVLGSAYKRPVVSEAKLRADGDRVIAKQMTECIRTLAKAIVESHNSLAEYQHKVTQQQTRYFTSLFRNLNECSRRNYNSLRNFTISNEKRNRGNYAKLSEKTTEQKHDFEKLLNIADKNVKTLEERLQEQEDELEKRKCGPDEHYDEEKGECVPNETPEEKKEAEEMKTKLQETATKVENLEAKLKGTFKGHSPQQDKKTPEHYEDPLKAKK